MADYIKKIRTEKGDLQIDYESLANLPQFDADWKAANNLADATVVNNKIKGVEDKVNAANTEINKLSDGLDQLEATVGALGGDLGDLGSQGFITGSAVDSKLANYVKNTDYASTSSYGVVKVGSGLSASSGVVSVDGNTLPHATTSSYGVVKPSDRYFWINSDTGELQVSMPLTSLNNLIVSTSKPTNLYSYMWYLIPASVEV